MRIAADCAAHEQADEQRLHVLRNCGKDHREQRDEREDLVFGHVRQKALDHLGIECLAEVFVVPAVGAAAHAAAGGALVATATAHVLTETAYLAATAATPHTH